MKKRDRIKKISFYIDVSDVNLDKNLSINEILQIISDSPVLDFEIANISKDEADTFELE